MFVLDRFPDAKPKFPERIAVSTPLGLRARVKKAAEAERVTVPDFIRAAIEQRLMGELSGRRVEQ